MFERSIQNAKDDLAGILHGTTVNSITGITALLERAMRTTLSRIDPSETHRRYELTVYDGVTEYDPPDGFKDRKFTDFKPQVNRTAGDSPRNVVGNDFDKAQANNTIRVADYDGEKVLKLIKRLTPAHTIFAHCQDGEGWAADGTGFTDLEDDTQIYVEGGHSLSFNKASGQTTGYLQTSSLSQIDFTDYEDIASVFAHLWVPTEDAANAISSADLRWGSSASDYWTDNATTPHNREYFRKGWNLIRFDWPTSDTGSPLIAAMDYLRFTLTTSTAAINGLRLDNIFLSIGKIFDLDYYSSYGFRNTLGVWYNNISDAGDDDALVNLGPTSYEIWLYEAAILCAQQLQGENSAADITFFREELYGNQRTPGLYAEYLEGNPNEAVAPRVSWY